MNVKQLLNRIEELSAALGAERYKLAECEKRLNLAQQAAIPPQAMPYQHIEELIRSVSANSKIGAIKEVRALTGWGLKESKDFVESAWYRQTSA